MVHSLAIRHRSPGPSDATAAAGVGDVAGELDLLDAAAQLGACHWSLAYGHARPRAQGVDSARGLGPLDEGD